LIWPVSLSAAISPRLAIRTFHNSTSLEGCSTALSLLSRLGAGVFNSLRAVFLCRPTGDRWSLPGVFLTPHVAASTPVSRQRAARLVREQAKAYLRGEPLRNVISGAY
jgi:hypothetical protein